MEDRARTVFQAWTDEKENAEVIAELETRKRDVIVRINQLEGLNLPAFSFKAKRERKAALLSLERELDGIRDEIKTLYENTIRVDSMGHLTEVFEYVNATMETLDQHRHIPLIEEMVNSYLRYRTLVG